MAHAMAGAKHAARPSHPNRIDSSDAPVPVPRPVAKDQPRGTTPLNARSGQTGSARPTGDHPRSYREVQAEGQLEADVDARPQTFAEKVDAVKAWLPGEPAPHVVCTIDLMRGGPLPITKATVYACLRRRRFARAQWRDDPEVEAYNAAHYGPEHDPPAGWEKIAVDQ